MAQAEEETRSRSAIVIKPGGRYVGKKQLDCWSGTWFPPRMHLLVFVWAMQGLTVSGLRAKPDITNLSFKQYLVVSDEGLVTSLE